jgi:hypothetical protein
MKPEDKAVVQQALEALEIGWSPTYTGVDAREKGMEAITALRQLLEQPVQEPVVRWDSDGWGDLLVDNLPDGTLLYTTPPAQPDGDKLSPTDAQPSTDHSEQHLDMVDHGDELTIAYLDGVHTGKQLAKRELLKALEELLEMQDEPCVIDHKGYCQSHYVDNVNSHGGCRVANARALVAKVKGRGT